MSDLLIAFLMTVFVYAAGVVTGLLVMRVRHADRSCQAHVVLHPTSSDQWCRLGQELAAVALRLGDQQRRRVL